MVVVLDASELIFNGLCIGLGTTIGNFISNEVILYRAKKVQDSFKKLREDLKDGI
jgi:hypothetical protein